MKTKQLICQDKGLFVLGLLFGILVLTACQRESRGFVLPVGNINTGKQLFVSMNCNDCHSIGDVARSTEGERGGAPLIQLGGEVTTLKAYGELVTSVINPSHKISQRHQTDQQLTSPEGASKMEARCYNDVMTVQELIDIVAFLQSEYELIVPTNTYPYQ
jgi:sulfur-oxidizing protein SoxX